MRTALGEYVRSWRWCLSATKHITITRIQIMFSDRIWILDCSALVRSLNVDKLLSEYLWSSDHHYRWDALLVSGYLWYFNAYSLHVGFSAAVSIIRFDTDLSFIASSLQIIVPNCWFEAAWILEMNFFYTCTYNGRYLASKIFFLNLQISNQ